VGADLASPELAAGAAGDGTALATGDAGGGTAPSGATLPSPLTDTSPVGGGGGGGFAAPDGGSGPVGAPPVDGGGGPAPAPGTPSDIVVGPGGLAEDLTQPVAPVTDKVIDLLSPDR
jgi:hypothetical protein